LFLKTRAANKFFLAFFFLGFAFSLTLRAQEVYVDLRHAPLYDFLDELGNEQLISVNSAVKPYTRKQVAAWLAEAELKTDSLNKRQQEDLAFFRKDYNKEILPGKFKGKRPDLYYYKDSLFTFSLNPILGIRYFNNDSGSFYHRWAGAEAFAYVGTHLGIYAALRDNHEDILMATPEYLNTLPAMYIKSTVSAAAAITAR
jgi:hypothetical protein